MRLGFLFVTIVLLAWASCPTGAASNVAYSRSSWNGIPVHVVFANLNSPDLKVTVSLAENGAGRSESFSSMLSRVRPAAAVTGTFFCTRSLLPTGDIVIEGMRVHAGSVGTGICFTPEKTVEFVPFSAGQRSGWQGYETVLCAGPRLVQNGSLFLIPREEGFTDPALFGKKKRTALGVTDSNKLLLVVVDRPIYLRTLAKIMLHLGAVDAVDLDGGSSSALYCNGRLISRPGRNLTNLLVVYDSLTDYYHHRQALAPQLRERIAASAKADTAPDLSGLPFTRVQRPETGEVVANDFVLAETFGLESPVDPGYRLTSEKVIPIASPRNEDAQFPPYEPASDSEGALLAAPSGLSLKSTRRLPRDPDLPTANHF